jgi:hypothetical protein
MKQRQSGNVRSGVAVFGEGDFFFFQNNRAIPNVAL